jgi:phosphoribosylaminoimidazolecarboxamide formyltransferase/IMP cyclohydrolase
MDPYQQVKEKLDELGISFDVVEHPPAFTTEQADSYIEGLEGVRTKTMFLTNKKKNLRILALPFDAQDASEVEAEYTGVVGGLLVQNQDVVKESPADWQVVTKRQPTETEATALEFAWKAIKYVKSNGIIVTNDHMTLGVGPGQTNRVASVRIAIDQAKDRLDGAVLASDAFFPFADNVEEIAKAGIKAIIQPGGSVRDQESIEAADKYGLTMVFTGVRHFRH